MMRALVAIKDRVQCLTRLFRDSGIREVAKFLRNVTLLERSPVIFPRFSYRHYFKNSVKIKIVKYAFLLFLFININQLDALNFIISLFQASTCFEHMCSSSGGQNCIIQSLVSSSL